MGPNLIFDKSFLQSITPDESVWLDMFFFTNLTPLFYIETLADLEKEVKTGRTPEDVVGNLAYKTPDLHIVPSLHHRTMLEGELLGGAEIDMRFGRPVVRSGRKTFVDGKHGAVLEQSAEEQAFARWQKRDFLNLERNQAKAWRHALSLISPRDQAAMFPGWNKGRSGTTLADAKEAADAYIDGENRRSSLTFGLSLLDVSPDASASIVKRWEQAGTPPITQFAPYFRHVYGVELLFYLARSSNLISPRRTNKVDIAYLYYLPFCMVFASSDNLHRKVVPLFLLPHQSFVWGWHLKADLSALDQHYSKLPEVTKARGLYAFASHPPHETTFLVTQLWDKHMRPDWRSLGNFGGEPVDNEAERKLVDEVNRAATAPEHSLDPIHSRWDTLDYVVTKHHVHKTKGKWNRFPPEVTKD